MFLDGERGGGRSMYYIINFEISISKSLITQWYKIFAQANELWFPIKIFTLTSI